MDPLTSTLVTLFSSIIVSLLSAGGFWAWLQTRSKTKTAFDRLVLGLAQDRIVTLGMVYIERGWITKDEYEDFLQRLYAPYSEAGGNGLAKRVMEEVASLKIYAREKTKTEPVTIIKEF